MTNEQKEKAILKVFNDGGSSTFATVIARLEQNMTKTGNPLRDKKVEKLVNFQFALNQIYQNVVNNQREREQLQPDFKSSSSWHEKVHDAVNGAILRNKKDHEKRYLSGIVKKSEIIEYFVDGEKATPEQVAIIKEFRKVSAPPQNQGYDNSPLRNPIIFRTISFENIKEIRTNGKILTF